VADEIHQALAAAEDTVSQLVADVLDDTAADFARALAGATEIVAARFSVGGIARMWRAGIPRIVRGLLGVTDQAAHRAAESVDATLPDSWTDLPGRHDAGAPLPPAISEYVTVTEHLLRAVGDHLAEAARRELAAGVDAGEDVDQLRARLRAAFTREGAQLGPAREALIAATEATRAWNTATLAAGLEVTGPDRPLVKQWITRRDTKVRDSHHKANGQLRLLDEPFTVGGVAMSAPGDPTAPPEEVCNCRCIAVLQAAPTGRNRTAAGPFDPKDAPRLHALESQENEVTDHHEQRVTAADTVYTGAMIALVPTEEDAQRLALDGGETAGQLHLTLYYLGEGADWTDTQRAELIADLSAMTASELTGPIAATAFGANHWNPGSDSPAWVWAVGDDPARDPEASGLIDARTVATMALENTHERPELPTQHSPWQPHVCAAYSDDPALLAALESRLGPITFDRMRVAFAGDYTDIPLGPTEATMPDQTAAATGPAPRTWSTPGDTGLAFEDQETGDGRIFAADSLYWEAGPWPLQHADEMLMGHDGAELAGAIQNMNRDGGRIAADGVLYPNRAAGADAIQLLDEEAPLGVSVDLDDVDMQFIDRTPADGDQESYTLAASLTSASLLRLDDGAWLISASSGAGWTASGSALSRQRHDVQLITGPDGRIGADVLRSTFAAAGITLTAAAGDTDNPDMGTVVHSESSGDLLLRITRARVRGATLVAMPAYNLARIVLDPATGDAPAAAPAAEGDQTAAAAGEVHQQVVTYVIGSPMAVNAREVAAALGITMSTARSHLVRAAKAGRLVRLAPGLYVGGSTIPQGEEVTAAASGDLELPVHDDREATWDGDQAGSRVLAWATAEDGTVDPGKLGSAFLWRDDTADPTTLGAYKLGFADLYGEGDAQRLEVVAAAVYAVAGVLQGAMGGVDIPEADQDAIRKRVTTLYGRLAQAYKDDSIVAPWDDQSAAAVSLAELEASAWSAMRNAPPMPAAWFQEPTEEELPPGSGGVHYAAGRVYGWVAQAGEPHAGLPGQNLTIESLGDIDLSHFLRARFPLDDGGVVRAGAMTMNVGHHRDGAECETAACQFDDTRTVAGVVTVGMNERGLWFSGAAAPWLSEWDALAFKACQPSYHMKQQRAGGRWELRAVLSVPVPGHSSPLLAAAVVERANLALTAAACSLLDTVPGQRQDTTDRPSGHDTDTTSDTAADLLGQRPDTASGQGAGTVRTGDLTAALTAALTEALTTPTFLDHLAAAMDRRTVEQGAGVWLDEEVERLTALVDLTPADLAASAASTTTKGSI